MHQTEYAGFWLRFVAFLVDSFLIGIVQSAVIFPILGTLGMSLAASGFDPATMNEAESMAAVLSILGTLGTTIIISQIIYVLYFTIMEASKFQATLGKMAVGLKVVDMEGNNLDFPKSLLRNLGKIISQLVLYIGFIIAGFTDKKQALHDIIAGALVIKK